MESHKMMTKIYAETLKKVSQMIKNGVKKDLPALPPREFFLVQFGIYLHLQVFQAARTILNF